MTTSVVREHGKWIVRVADGHKCMLEYRYGSEQQARFMAAVFALSPSRRPAPDVIWALKPERARRARSAPRPRAPKAVPVLHPCSTVTRFEDEITLVDVALQESELTDEPHAQVRQLQSA